MDAEVERIVLDERFDEDGTVSALALSGETVHRMGILRSTHEFELQLDPRTLGFLHAYSIDYGSINEYGDEDEFMDAFPGVFGSIFEAKKNGTLEVRTYVWDPVKRFNHPLVEPYADYIAKTKGGI